MLFISVFFFLVNIHTAMATKKIKSGAKCTKAFVGQKEPQKLQYFEGKKKSELTIFDNEFLEARLPAKTKQDPLKNSTLLANL
jgi:hypothetical protein